MKNIAWFAACAAMAAASAYAQQVYDPAVPRALSDPRVAPSATIAPPVIVTGTPVEPVVPQLAMNVRRHQRDSDARHCLQFTTNREIHRCAERYRSRSSLRLTKTVAKKTIVPPDATAIVREKTVETVTVTPAKPAESARPVAKSAEAKSAAPVAPPAPTPPVAAKSGAPGAPSATKPIEPAKTVK